MLKIIVCIKQVPATTQVSVDPETGVLLRSGAKAKLNPYDLFAIECAVRLKERCGASITALSMGPAQAQAALWEAVYMGADQGVLLCDRRFAGADVLATSHTLAGAVSALGGADLIICGKQTTDGDTAQVGAELAELLALPHACNITALGDISAGRLTCQSTLDSDIYSLSISLPCLITVEKDIYTPRLPSYKLRKAAGADAVRVWGLGDIGGEQGLFGLSGSPTQVQRVFPPQKATGQEVYEGPHLGARLHEILAGEKLI